MGEKVTRRYTCDMEWMKFPADPEGRASGPVKEYTLSPEELAEYNNLRKPTGKAPINLKFANAWGRKRKEEDEMFIGENGAENMPENMPTPDNIVHDSEITAENKGSGVDEKEDQPDNVVHDRPRTRMELAREKLSSEEYLRLKEEGRADSEIRALFKIAGDVLVNLKKEWCLPIGSGVATHKQNPVQSPPAITPQPDPVPQRESEPSPAPVTQLNESRPSGLTIAQALELRDELIEDIDDYNHIIFKDKVSERVIQVISQQRDIHQQALDRINEVFERTVVEL